MTDVGYATLQIIPSMAGVGAKIESQLGPQLATAGKKTGLVAGKNVGTGIVEGTKTSTAAARTSMFGNIEKGAAVAGVGAGKRFGTALSSTAGTYIKTIGATMVGFLAVDKISDFFGALVSEGRDANKTALDLAAALKSTDGAASVTAEHINKLAESLALKVGLDNDAIVSGETLELTFQNISNAAGKGNAVFDRTAKVALDASARLGKDLRGALILVGKAVNDPIKGMTALTRVGVAFTDQQKEQIARLVESGNLLAAQKIVLGGLEERFKGAAAAQTDAVDRLHVSWVNFEQELGLKVVPVLSATATGLSQGLLPAMQDTLAVAGKTDDVFAALPKPIQETALALGALVIAQKLFQTSFVQGVFTSTAAGIGNLQARTQLASEAFTTASATGGRFSATLSAIRAGSLSTSTQLKQTSRAASGIAGLALAFSGLSESSSAAVSNIAQIGTAALLGASINPWVGAITGGAVAVKLLFQNSDKAVVSSESLSASLNQQTGAITENTRSIVAKGIADKGLIDDIQTLHLSAGLVTGALLDQGDAAEFLNAKLQPIIESGQNLAGGDRELTVTQLARIDAAQKLSDAMGAQNSDLKEAVRNWRFEKAAVDGAAGAQGRGTAATQDGAAAMDDMAKALENATTQQNHYADAVLEASGSQLSYKQAVLDAQQALKDNKHTLDTNTQAGIDNRTALNNLAQGWNDLGAKVQSRQGAYEHARQTFIDTATAMGLERDAAKDLAAKILDIPTDHVTKVTADVTQATRDILAFVPFMNDQLGKIDDEPVGIHLTAQASKVEAQLARFAPHALGGPIFGPGTGTSDSIPAMLSAGEHVWTAQEVARAGGHGVVAALRRLAKMGELPKRGDISRFAGGGAVELSASNSGVGSAIGAVSTFFDSIAAAVSTALSKRLSDLLTHIPSGGLGPDTRLSPAQLAKGQAAARSVLGYGYVWGGASPAAGGFDCSGLQSWLLHQALGDGSVSRLGTSASAPWPGSRSGVGGYTMGYNPNVGGTGIGHMTGNIAGLNAESYGGHGVAIGAGARSPLDALFTGVFHYDKGGVLPPGYTMAYNGTGSNEFIMRFAGGGGVPTVPPTHIPPPQNLPHPNWPDIHFPSPGQLLSLAHLMDILSKPAPIATLAGVNKAFRAMRAEARDVVAAERDMRAARFSSRNAAHQVNVTEKLLQQARNAEVKDKGAIHQLEDRLHRQREKSKADDKDLTKAEKALSKQRDELSAATEKWRANEQALIEQAKTIASTITDLGSAFGGEGTSTTAAGFLAKLTSTTADATRFKRLIAQLKKRGLDKDVIKQIEEQGPTPDGLALAQSLASAPISLIRRINAQQRALEQIANQVGAQSTGGVPGHPGQHGHGPHGGHHPRDRIVEVNFNAPVNGMDEKKLAHHIWRRGRQAVAIAGSP